MKKLLVVASLCILGASVAAGIPNASAEVQINANIHTGHSSISFEQEPDVVVVPGTRVYYYEAPSYDVYRYGSAWWVDRGGVWYRSASYRGPFVQVTFQRVPHQVIVIPAEYHRHDNGWHRGWEKQEREEKHHRHHEDGDDDNDQGNGHGNSHHRD
jgi:hypothetical protein